MVSTFQLTRSTRLGLAHRNEAILPNGNKNILTFPTISGRSTDLA